jgi:hypothetical protein
MFATSAFGQSCEIDFQSMFMKVIWSIADYLSTTDTKSWLDQVFATLAPGQS